ncbi:MAG: GNAT family N-acetyltransferase [Chloroflexi bacterium]|nr:GNAT family N-acetyltransferase [Chloroflexota bacterium]
MSAAFAAIGWVKPVAQYQQYLAEQAAGDRSVLVARLDGTFAGYVTVRWRSDYEPFHQAGIPEIQDLNVLPHLRRWGIGTQLLDEAEALVATRSDAVGLGVGLYADYGPAQRLYVRRGYVPDGRGIAAKGVTVRPMETVTLDDDLTLYFTKSLGAARTPSTSTRSHSSASSGISS